MSSSASTIELRTGSSADLAVVGAIMAAAFDPRYGEAWTTSQCMGILALPGVWLTLAHLDGDPAGFALSRVAGGEAELLLLASRPDLRRRGVGGSLLRTVIRDARERGADILHLEVRADNSAIFLYVAEGFAKVGVRRDYYRGTKGDVFDAHTFSRPLKTKVDCGNALEQ